MKARDDVLRIATEARRALERAYGQRLREVRVFGSFARGDAGEDSDLDLAVVLDEVPDRFREHERTSDLQSDLSLGAGVLVNFFFVPEGDYLSGRYALFRAIKREGVTV